MSYITYNQIENLVRAIFKYTHGIDEKLTLVELCFANEINSVNHVESFYKIIELIRADYKYYHYTLNDSYYDVFIYEDEDVNPDNKYQCILCDNYTQVFNFKEGEYHKKQLVSSFRNPGRLYSFVNGYVIVVENNKKIDGIKYKEINLIE